MPFFPLFETTFLVQVKNKTCYFKVLNVLGHAVAQLVKALRYKPEGHGFDSQWFQWNFSLT